MKKTILLAVLFLAGSVTAHAYVSGSPSPDRGEPENEYRIVTKSTTAGFSDAVAKGDILSLDVNNTNDGYTVTRVGANNVASAGRILCIAKKAIATGEVGLIRCVSRGYVDYLKYDATTPISGGQKLCANSVGAAVACATCDLAVALGANNCAYGSATANTPIMSLDWKASGTGTNLKAIILSR